VTTTDTPSDANPGESGLTDAVSGLFGRDLVYMAFWSAQLILVACITPVLTRLIRQDQIGLVAAAIAVMQLLNVLFGFGLQTAVQREYSGQGGDRGARELVTLAAVLAVLVGGIFYAAGPLWSPLIGLTGFPTAVRYAVIWAVLIPITIPALGLMRSRSQIGFFITISFLQSIFAEMVALSLVIFVKATAAEYLLGQTIGQLLAAIVALVGARPARLTRLRIPMLVDALRFSTALVPAMIASFVSAAADRLIIHADLGSRITSHYSVASNIGNFTVQLLGFLDFVWLPRLFAIKDRAARRAVLGASRDGLYVLGAAFAIAIAYGSPIILRLWCPPSYHPDSLVPIVVLITAGALPFADSVVYTQALILVGRSGSVAIATALAAVVNLTFNLLLVPSLGIKGSAAITLGTYVLYALALRLLAGANGPVTNAWATAAATAAVALCVVSGVLPTGGVVLGLRLVVALLAGVVFVIKLFSLVNPDFRGKFDRWLMRSRWGAALSRLTSL
jgi:O-antigen/teichoic acid export membrane protein